MDMSRILKIKKKHGYYSLEIVSLTLNGNSPWSIRLCRIEYINTFTKA